MPDPSNALGVPPAALLSPDDYYALQREQLMEQMALGQMQQPVQPQNYGAMASRASPIAGLTRMASALMASKAMQQQQQTGTRLAQAMMGAGGNLLSTATGTPQTASSAPTPTGSGPPAAPSQPASYGTRMASLNQAVRLGLVDKEMAGKIADQIAAENKVPDLDSALRGAGIQPGTDLYRQVMGQAVGKANYVAPAELREGNILATPNLGIFGTDYKPAFQNPRHEFVPDPFKPGTGNWNTAPAAPGVPVAGQPAAQPGAPKQYFAQPPPTSEPSVTSAGAPGATAGALESEKAGATQGAQSGQAYSDDLAKSAGAAVELHRSLSELKSLAGQGGVSVANPYKQQLGGILISAGMDPQAVGQMLHTDVGALVAATKETSNLARENIKEMTSRGTNFDLSTFMRYNPNLDMASPEGFSRVVDFLDKVAKDQVDKQSDFEQWKAGQPQANWASGHTARWNAQQMKAIDAGQTNSKPGAQGLSIGPRTSKVIGGKTYYSLGNGRWSDTP